MRWLFALWPPGFYTLEGEPSKPPLSRCSDDARRSHRMSGALSFRGPKGTSIHWGKNSTKNLPLRCSDDARRSHRMSGALSFRGPKGTSIHWGKNSTKNLPLRCSDDARRSHQISWGGFVSWSHGDFHSLGKEFHKKPSIAMLRRR